MAEKTRTRKLKPKSKTGAAPSRPPSSISSQTDTAVATLGPKYFVRPAFTLKASDERELDESLPVDSRLRAAALANRPDPSEADAGSPIDPAIREEFERRFGYDFSRVRLHTGDEPASALARAYAKRNHIWLDSGAAGDRTILAHELTHVVQQGYAQPLQRSAPSVGLGGAKAAPQPAAPPTPAVQRWSIWDAAKSVGGAVVSGVKRAAGAVADVAGDLLSLGKDALLAMVRKVAPGLMDLLEGGGIGKFLKKMISKGVKSLFSGLLGPFKSIFNISGLGAKFGAAIGWLSTVIGQLARNDCSAVVEAANKFSAFISSVFGPVIDKVRGIASKVSGFFSSITDAISQAVMPLLKKIGGAVWESLRGFLGDMADLIKKARSYLGAAWGKVKGWLGIKAEDGESEGGGLWNWIKEKASAVWSAIKGPIEPILGPLKVVGGVLLMISPAGPIIAVIKAWPHLKTAFNAIKKAWGDLNLLVRARELYHGTIIPMVVGAANTVADALQNGAAWLAGLLDKVAAGVQSAAEGIGGGVFAPLAKVIGFARSKFKELVNWGRGALKGAASTARSALRKLIELLQTVGEVLVQIGLIAVNPLGVPMFLAGTLWRIMPYCLKAIIIDFVVDILIKVLRALPGGPQTGPLWPFLQAGILGFLEKVKSFAMERKVAVSNKLAKIAAGGSIGFFLGFLKGLALGVFDGIVGPFLAIADLFQLPALIKSFLGKLGLSFKEIFDEIKAFAANIGERAIGTLDMLLEAAQDLLQNPQKILELITTAIEGALDTVSTLGAQLAEQMMEFFEQAEEKIGESVGRLAGSLLVDAVLAYFTAGSSTALSSLRVVAKALRSVGKALGKVVKMITSFIPKILKFVKKIGNVFKKVGSKASAGASKIRAFFQRIVNWFKKILRKLTRGKKLNPADARKWMQFKAAIRAGIAPHKQQGMKKSQLKSLYNSARSRFRSVVKTSLRPVRKHEQYWEVYARRKKRPIATKVGRVLLDRDTRWKAGNKAIKKAVKKLKKRTKRIGTSDIESLLKPIKKKYHYKTLSTTWDRGENDWDVKREMSPGDTLEIDAPAPDDNGPATPLGGRSGKMDPIVRHQGFRTPASGTPAEWPEIEKIRSKSGKSTLYIKGHIISGWFAPGSTANLTPITRSNNARMSSGGENWLRKQVAGPGGKAKKDSKGPKVFSYTVRGQGTGGQTSHPRKILENNVPVWKIIPEESTLVNSMALTVTRKKYDPAGKQWIDGDVVKSSGAIDNVPPYPKGWGE